jgi:hypothetical protein
MELLKYQILETTKTFILNPRLISCLLKLVNLSICSHASNKKSMRRVLKQILWAQIFKWRFLLKWNSFLTNKFCAWLHAKPIWVNCQTYIKQYLNHTIMHLSTTTKNKLQRIKYNNVWNKDQLGTLFNILPKLEFK